MRSSFLFKKNGIVSATLALFLSLVVALTASANSNVVWLTAGQGRTNWRYQPLESTISNQNVANLAVKWSATGADVSATPSVSDGVVYYPDWAGNLYARNVTDGSLVW